MRSMKGYSGGRGRRARSDIGRPAKRPIHMAGQRSLYRSLKARPKADWSGLIRAPGRLKAPSVLF